MSMIGFVSKGNFNNTNRFLKAASKLTGIQRKRVKAIAEEGKEALSKATPVRTGKTAASWSYEIEEKSGKLIVYWTNSNVIDGVNIAIILQYGHGTRNGGYVTGIDYINSALQPVFDKMISDMWEAVVSL